MIQTIVKKGKVIKEEVLTPNVSYSSVLIKVVNSCISPGTELSGIDISGKSIIKKALEQPEKVRKALDWVFNDGIDSSIIKYKSETEIGSPTGYSLSGIVIGLGKNVTEFNLGDKVVAVGGGYANHAEIVDVPKNLVVKMPADLDFISASTAALGSIALNGIRRANLQIGEFAVVYGTGLIGLITLQILIHSGIRVATIDKDNERLEISKKFGAEISFNGDDSTLIKQILNWTDGYGADAVIFTASTSSNLPLSNSFKMCKRKGKVVLVGVSGMQIQRSDIYKNEIDFLISSSYGPGRYDRNYEEKGLDYPYAFVRWTINRNIKEYLRLLKIGAVNINELKLKIVEIENVVEAFELLKSNSKPLGIILQYHNTEQNRHKILISTKYSKCNKINIAVVGIGGFAKSVLLPNLYKLRDKFNLVSLMSNSSHKVKGFSDIYNPAYITNNYDELLNDENIDLIFIATRHRNHGELVIKAIQKGKNIFVEKPLTINHSDLETIEKHYQKNSSPILMVGYNRRFSKYACEIKKHIINRINPLIINYRFNAGYLPKDHWIYEQGGRIIGEACHIFDLFNFLIESEVESINVESINPKNDFFSKSDNKIMTLKYKDGSLANFLYFANGNEKLEKEYMEVHFDGKTIVMDNYQKLAGFGIKLNTLNNKQPQKGHLEELIAIYETLSGIKENWPISLNDLLNASQISLIADSLY